MASGKVYLIPTVLYEDSLATIPAYILDNIKACQVFFVENEKTTRRFFKKLWKEMVIDDYQWFAIHKAEPTLRDQFLQILKSGKNIGIVSEAGCPGVADPGQYLIASAQQAGIQVKPLVGPSSILLALMASGMNGQIFQFHGYLPIDSLERKNKVTDLENDSQRRKCTQLFIETPYRNNAIIKDLLTHCKDSTLICIAVDITGPTESIQTKTVRQWKQSIPDIHKRLAIFLLLAE
jgi:16S rRNA (cytidine1402-2'-O)-methyltransferase